MRRSPPALQQVHLGTATILKGSNSISPETCYRVASCRYHHPERMESISPGLRGTSYPGFTATDAGYPERVVSNSSARPGGGVKSGQGIRIGTDTYVACLDPNLPEFVPFKKQVGRSIVESRTST